MVGVLSYKQAWRRQNWIPKANYDSNNFKQQQINEKEYALKRCEATHGTTKKVRFMCNVSVILIPVVSEYREANLMEAMWWSVEDFEDFRQDAIDELHEYMLWNVDIDYRRALYELYQPHNSVEDEIQILSNKPSPVCSHLTSNPDTDTMRELSGYLRQAVRNNNCSLVIERQQQDSNVGASVYVTCDLNDVQQSAVPSFITASRGFGSLLPINCPLKPMPIYTVNRRTTTCIVCNETTLLSGNSSPFEAQ